MADRAGSVSSRGSKGADLIAIRPAGALFRARPVPPTVSLAPEKSAEPKSGANQRASRGRPPDWAIRGPECTGRCAGDCIACSWVMASLAPSMGRGGSHASTSKVSGLERPSRAVPCASTRKGLGVLEWTGKVPQGLLVRPVKASWNAVWLLFMTELAPRDREGSYVRPDYSLRGAISPSPGADFPVEAGRYHLVRRRALAPIHAFRVVRAVVLATSRASVISSTSFVVSTAVCGQRLPLVPPVSPRPGHHGPRAARHGDGNGGRRRAGVEGRVGL